MSRDIKMQITYNLKSSQKLGFSYSLALSVWFWLFLMTLYIDLFSTSNGIFQQGMIFSIVIAIIVFVVTYYCLVKNLKLIIDESGIRITSKLLSLRHGKLFGLQPHFAYFLPIRFDSKLHIYRLQDCIQTNLSYLVDENDVIWQKEDTLFAFVNRHKKSTQVFLISNTIWEIEDINLLGRQLNQLGLTAEVEQAQVFIEEFMPELSGLGKKAMYIAFASIVLFVSILIVTSYDAWSTIYYGWFGSIVWLVLLIFAALAFWYIKTYKQHLSAHILIASLFAMCFTLLFLTSLLAITAKVGTDLPLTFEYTETNEFKEETWTATENPKLKIFCNTNKNNKQVKMKQGNDKISLNKPDVQKTTAKKWFSIIRVDGSSLCPHGVYLSDSMLPHE